MGYHDTAVLPFASRRSSSRSISNSVGGQIRDVNRIFDLKDQELEEILCVLFSSGLIILEQTAYLAPTPIADIFLNDNAVAGSIGLDARTSNNSNQNNDNYCKP